MSEAPAEGLITAELRAFIGRASTPIVLQEPVSAADVRRYVEVTGDDNPAWLDDEAARAAGYERRVLPPTMVIALSHRLRGPDTTTGSYRLPLPATYTDVRNADTEITWHSELYIGERVILQERILDITAREGRRGVAIYVTRLSEYRHEDGRLVAEVRHTSVALPAPSETR